MSDSLAVAPTALRDHALLADGERGAVIDQRGAITWLCIPRWHDEPVFSALLDGSGIYTVRPADPWHVWGGAYRRASLVWCSRWVTSDGLIECEEALAHPGAVDRAVVLRRIRAVAGAARLTVLLRAVGGFDDAPVRDLTMTNGVWTGRAGDLRIRWQGAAAAELDETGGLRLTVDLAEGATHDLVLELARTDLADRPPAAAALWEETLTSWQRTVPDLGDLLAVDEVRQSYAVLAGLTSRDHGMVAAATMALPERAGGSRNYDYRYAWIRDQCYAGQAVAALGPYPLLQSALEFVTDRVLADGPELRPAYKVDGDTVPEERHTGLSGYPGGGDVAGNRVTHQFQLDCFGEALSLYAAAAAHYPLDARCWRAVRACVAAIERRYRDAEAGIWELADELWTQSRLACVGGLRAIAQRTTSAERTRWRLLSDRILAEITSTCLHPSGRWQQSPTSERVDAALLLPPVRGALPADDPRTIATREAVVADLVHDGYVYRFRHSGKKLAEAEGAFTLCGFLMALAQAQAGADVLAVHYYERARSACATSGLFTEEFDVAQRQLRGNLPQAFVHALFIEATARVDEVLRRGRRGDRRVERDGSTGLTDD